MPDSWDFTEGAKKEEQHPTLLTWAIVALCVCLTILWWTSANNPTLQGLAATLTPTPDHIWEGRYYSLFTSVFIHGSILHLGFNMIWLLRLGAVLEQTLNPLAWAAFFIASAVVGSCAELAVTGHTGIGASGAVYAMFGLMWAGRGVVPVWRMYATRENLNYFIGWGVLCVFLTYFNVMAIANGAHFGGLLFGLAIGWLFIGKRNRVLAAGMLALTFIVMVLSVTWMPWSGTWIAWTAGEAFDKKDYPLAIERYQRSMKFGYDREIAWENIARSYHNMGNLAAEDEARSHNTTAKVEDERTTQQSNKASDIIQKLRNP